MESTARLLGERKTPKWKRWVILLAVLIVCGLLIGVILVVGRRTPVTPPNPSTLVSGETIEGIRKLVNSAYNTRSSIFYDRIAWWTDTYGPRFSGTQALEDSLDGARDMIMQDGLNVTEEPVMIPRWVRGQEYVRMITPRVKNLVMIGLGGTNSTRLPNGTKGPVRGEVIVVANFTELAARAAEVPGKIVLFNYAPWVNYPTSALYRRAGVFEAAKYGAIGMLVRSVTPWSLQTPHTGSGGTGTIAAAAITMEDSYQIKRMVDRGSVVELEMYLEMERMADVPSRNLVVEYPGTKYPDEYVIIGGHTDSWDNAEGATDDASGAFLGWEAIRLLHTLGLKTDRTILGVMWVNEENGMNGAAAFLNARYNQTDKMSFAIESDDGGFFPHTMYVNGTKEAMDILAEMAGVAFGVVGDKGVPLPGGRVLPSPEVNADIGPLNARGVTTGGLIPVDPLGTPGVANPCRPPLLTRGPLPVTNNEALFFGGTYWVHHTAADTVDKLDPDDLRMSAHTAALWVYTVANLPMLLPQAVVPD